jgi:hypothetical protein
MTDFSVPDLQQRTSLYKFFRFFSEPSRMEFNHFLRMSAVDQAMHFQFPASEFIFEFDSCLQNLESQERQEGKNIFPMSKFVSCILKELRSFQCDPATQVIIIGAFRTWLDSFKDPDSTQHHVQISSKPDPTTNVSIQQPWVHQPSIVVAIEKRPTSLDKMPPAECPIHNPNHNTSIRQQPPIRSSLDW